MKKKTPYPKLPTTLAQTNILIDLLVDICHYTFDNAQKEASDILLSLKNKSVDGSVRNIHMSSEIEKEVIDTIFTVYIMTKEELADLKGWTVTITPNGQTCEVAVESNTYNIKLSGVLSAPFDSKETRLVKRWCWEYDLVG